jgi:hypothetical protein
MPVIQAHVKSALFALEIRTGKVATAAGWRRAKLCGL